MREGEHLAQKWFFCCFRYVLKTLLIYKFYAKAVLKFAKLNTVAQQREAVTPGRSLLPYRLRYNLMFFQDYSKQSVFFFVLYGLNKI
jgi:hypothetical protein